LITPVVIAKPPKKSVVDFQPFNMSEDLLHSTSRPNRRKSCL